LEARQSRNEGERENQSSPDTLSEYASVAKVEQILAEKEGNQRAGSYWRCGYDVSQGASLDRDVRVKLIIKTNSI
jgi:hypothetical protein